VSTSYALNFTTVRLTEKQGVGLMGKCRTGDEKIDEESRVERIIKNKNKKEIAMN